VYSPNFRVLPVLPSFRVDQFKHGSLFLNHLLGLLPCLDFFANSFHHFGRPSFALDHAHEPIKPALLLSVGHLSFDLLVFIEDHTVGTHFEVLLGDKRLGVKVDHGERVATAVELGLHDLAPPNPHLLPSRVESIDELLVIRVEQLFFIDDLIILVSHIRLGGIDLKLILKHRAVVQLCFLIEVGMLGTIFVLKEV
jgi:hypothetical protein